MAQEPRCPKCHTMVQPSWDWCMGCGYDPAGRKPGDWTPSTPASSPATTIDLSDDAARTPLGAGQRTATQRRLGGTGAARGSPPGRAQGTRVTTLVGPGAAQPQEMRRSRLGAAARPTASCPSRP